MQIIATFLTLSIIIFISGCRSCVKSEEPEITIAATPIILEGREIEVIAESVIEKKSNIKHITIGPRNKKIKKEYEPEPEVATKKMTQTALPPNTYEETDLSARLRDKMLDAYKGREDQMPDVKIYLSEMNYDEFIAYYKGLGYRVRTVAVPARQVIEPVLNQRPELAGKINIAAYDDIVIHQVMVNEAGISAADKYIDPDTFQVIDKTFVTKVSK